MAQAEKLAKRTRVPFGLLFLQEPPRILQTKIPDLRQTTNPAPLSDDFFDVLNDVTSKQIWFAEHRRKSGGEQLAFVGRFHLDKKPSTEAIAEDIRATIGLSDDDRRRSAGSKDYFSAISDKAEAAGILVMKSGIVRSNTRRPLSEKEFRGFALADHSVPLVFINGRDAEVASVFTLVHEIAHVWLGESGVSDVILGRSSGLERLCNQIAAEVLLPHAAFLAQWARVPDMSVQSRYFRVSNAVAAIRAFELKKISQQELDTVLRQPPNARRAKTGGDGLKTIPVRNSKRFTRSIVGSAIQGETLIRDAARLLNIRPDTVISLGREFAKIRG